MNNSNLSERTAEIRSTAVFSKDNKRRYLLKFEWDSNKPKSCMRAQKIEYLWGAKGNR